MLKVLALWPRPNDPAAFDAEYLSRHMPLAGALPGLAGLSTGSAADEASPYYRVTELQFPDEETLQAAMTSEEMGRVVADVEALQAGHGVTMSLVTLAVDGDR